MVVCRNRNCHHFEPHALPLYNRHRIILQRMIDGMTPAQIADDIGYSERTVRQSLFDAVDKVGCKNVHHLMVLAAKYGAVTCPPFLPGKTPPPRPASGGGDSV
jgi:DNA-binding CsgD family transcriptional regulator